MLGFSIYPRRRDGKPGPRTPAGAITLSQNPSTGNGGWCYGDSGSANFLGDSNVMASLVITTDGSCRSLGTGYRLETEFARQFLASQGVPLP